MATASDDFAPRSSPLEYWFIKLHAGDLAFLVDFIVRRQRHEAEVRISLWVRGQGRVARGFASSWRADGVTAIGDSLFTTTSTHGAIDDIAWSLDFVPQADRAAPRVPLLSGLRPFDLDLISYPRTVFTGDVSVGGERFPVGQAYGSVTHYWGRRLPDRWHWISANAFDGGDLTIEAVAMRTRLWGRGPGLAAGYLWTYQNGEQRLLVSPINGLITVAGAANDYTFTAYRPGQSTRLRCTAAPGDYNDLGEGIHQTLLGSCTVTGLDLTDTRAGLEYRHSLSR